MSFSPPISLSGGAGRRKRLWRKAAKSILAGDVESSVFSNLEPVTQEGIGRVSPYLCLDHMEDPPINNLSLNEVSPK